MRAANDIYEVKEGRPFWKRRPLQVAITLLMVLLVALVAVALVLTGSLANAVGDAIGVGKDAVSAWEIVKWPVMLIVVMTTFALLYYVAPNVRQPSFRWITPGGILGVLIWVIASAGFGLYVANYGSYNKTYGALASVITFLVWLWLTNLALLIGAEFDSELERERGTAGRSALRRLQSDERLIALTRRGGSAAFETLVLRYQSRLLAFCRHMLGSTEDAEDVLQEVFTASFNAILADDRPINARPWLYRIARNRCLNHLRRPAASGQDSMDIFERDGGTSTADTVHKREEFRQIVADVQDLPESQRTALLLREIDALSYDDISETMDTTVPSVKSLLVRARVSLAEAAEARLLTCAEVRLELGHVAEGIARSSAPVRRHLKGCERCRVFKGELRRANRALAAVYPLGPLVLVKKFLAAK